MNPLKIIDKYYDKHSKAYSYLTTHSKMVANKAIKISMQLENLKLNIRFIEEASMLHNIGIFLTNAPEIGCNGEKPYVAHGYLGRELLEKEGYPEHALVCERHVGVGISKDEIIKNNLPLPKRDMSPITLEEQIICFADKFFSKTKLPLTHERSVEEVKNKLEKYGKDKVEKFEYWLDLFYS